MINLAGKTVVLTGAGSGQGAAETRYLAETGARVLGLDVCFAEKVEHPRVELIEHDVADPSAWSRLAARIDEEGGQIHGLVNNAAVPGRTPLLEVGLAEWDRVMAVNVTGPLLAIQTIAPRMTTGGSIVNISSLAGATGVRVPAYSTSKWALRGLSLVASHELGERGIRVNTLLPGYIDTPFVRQYPSTITSATLAQIPLGRVGTPDDVCPLVAFLLSDDAAWISGAEIAVDGGQSSHGGTKVIYDIVQGKG